MSGSTLLFRSPDIWLGRRFLPQGHGRSYSAVWVCVTAWFGWVQTQMTLIGLFKSNTRPWGWSMRQKSLLCWRENRSCWWLAQKIRICPLLHREAPSMQHRSLTLNWVWKTIWSFGRFQGCAIVLAIQCRNGHWLGLNAGFKQLICCTGAIAATKLADLTADRLDGSNISDFHI